MWQRLKHWKIPEADNMLRIKQEYRNTVIAFQDSGVALYKRPFIQLIDLAILAHRSKDETLIRLFETPMPSVVELKKMKMMQLEV